MINPENEVPGGFRELTSVRPQLFPAQIPEEEYSDEDHEVVLGDIGIGSGLSNYSREWPRSEIPVEELGFSGNEIGKGSSGGSGGNSDRRKMGAYYEEMLKTDPTNSLLLTNYGKFLHEVEGNTVKAEEYYERAILASPGDGEILSFYGKLIWEVHRDGDRAKSYFDQAVHASPDDCMVLGSYAQFMWEIEEDEEEEEEEEVAIMSAAAVIEAF